ncbi:L,D-transpeptidase [Synergistes jonesii]
MHGTHDPLSIGKNVTEGCIRLANDDLDRLKKEYVTTGMKVVVVK